ncbi:hypothetical protein [Enterobacter asburiae]|nr:hypothetical protein [Salmonella enterica]EJG8857836.1 hypothetical protein [Salmonella enterica]
MNSIKEIRSISVGYSVINDIKRGRNEINIFSSIHRVDIDYLVKYLRDKYGSKLIVIKKLDSILAYSKHKKSIKEGTVILYIPDEKQDKEMEEQYLSYLKRNISSCNAFFINFKDISKEEV